MSKNTKKKIGLLGCLVTGVGSIIGTGIFGSLPEVVNSVGAGCIWALIGATIYTIFNMIPNMFSTSVIPASGSMFLYAAKLVHPVVGFFMAAQSLLQPVLIAVFSVLFADYFTALFPNLVEYKSIISASLLIVYFLLAWFGNHAIVSFNSIVVVVMLCAIGAYVCFGLPNLNPGQLTVADVLHPGMNLTTFGAAISILSSSLSGASSVSQIANDLKNPHRDIPVTLFVAPCIVCFIYILMAVVTLGCMPNASIATLSEVGATFMPGPLLAFFIIGGPLCGSLAPMVPVILLTTAQIEAAAESNVFPAIMRKRNRHNVSVVVLAYVMTCAILIVASGASFGVLMTVFSTVNILANIPNAIVPFFISKRYPHAVKHAGIRLNKALVFGAGIFVVVSSIYLAIQAVLTLNRNVCILLLVVAAACTLYFVLRVRYLGFKGTDLIRDLKEPYPSWESREKECHLQDE